MSLIRPGFLRLFAVLALASGACLWGQEITGRAAGEVTGADERPLAGAEVRVWPSGSEAAGRSPVTADAEGR